MSVLISIGDWGDDASTTDRQSFYVRIRLRDGAYEVGVYDSELSPWGEIEILGRTLDRPEALAHPRIKDIFHVTDHIVAEDQPIIEYFSQGT